MALKDNWGNLNTNKKPGTLSVPGFLNFIRCYFFSSPTILFLLDKESYAIGVATKTDE